MTDVGLRPLDLLASGKGLVGDSLHAATVLGRARLVRPLRPDRPPHALAAIQRWGFTPAGGYAAAAPLNPTAEALSTSAARSRSPSSTSARPGSPTRSRTPASWRA